MAEPWLVAGLGNPGEKYAATRHNIGTRVVLHLAETFGVRLRKVRFISAVAAEATSHGVPLLLVLPGTAMNLSPMDFVRLVAVEPLPASSSAMTRWT